MIAILWENAMVSIEKIVQKFLQLDEHLGLLRNISKKPIKDFLNDKIVTAQYSVD